MRESSQALAAFGIYLRMGPDRSIDEVARQLHKSRTLIGRWSGAHGWQARVAEHEKAIAHKAAVRDQDVRLAEMERQRVRRLKDAENMRSKAADALKLMNTKKLATQPHAVIRLFETANKTERLDTGQPTERIDVTELSDAELIERIARLERTSHAP